MVGGCGRWACGGWMGVVGQRVGGSGVHKEFVYSNLRLF